MLIDIKTEKQSKIVYYSITKNKQTMTQDTIKTIIGTAGVAGVETVQHLDPILINQGVGLIGQIVIIVATLISLFKKKKPNA